MRPHPRIRKVVKWGASILTVLLMVLWIGSWWYGLLVVLPTGVEIEFATGTLCVGRLEPDLTGLWHGFYLCSPRLLTHSWGLLGGTSVPFWPFPAATALIAVIPWGFEALARRRARTGFCPKCNYNRTGLPVGGPCPECGATAPPPAPAAT